MTVPGSEGDGKVTPGQYDFTEQIGHLLRRAYQRHTAIFSEVIPDSKLTATQFVVLHAVKDRESCSVNEIVRATAIDQGTMRGIVERLKSRKLIRIAEDKTDRRKLVVSLTKAGEQLIAEIVPYAKKVTELTYGDFNAAERLALSFLLRRMTEGGQEPAAPSAPASS
ncbi:MarR family transcriptional regulator [Variovorax paradoxus]|nr:MarR family transcriptional regulator [Variovorax paradoxus]